MPDGVTTCANWAPVNNGITSSNSATATAAMGFRSQPWEGAKDGPLFSEAGTPSFLQAGNLTGGRCGCKGTVTTSDGRLVSTVPSADLPGGADEQQTWWQCVADPCSVANPDATYDTLTGVCKGCRVGGYSSSDPPFNTQVEYSSGLQMSTCLPDPCNPDGVSTTANISCDVTSENNCSGVCLTNKCYLPPSTASCNSDSDCTGSADGACVNGFCAYLDQQRAAMGHSCSSDGECSYGTCTTVNGVSTCTGACSCSSGNSQIENALSLNGYTCKSACQGNSCLNGGSCYINDQGVAACKCPSCYSGPNCETIETSSSGQALGAQGSNCMNFFQRDSSLCCSSLTCQPAGLFNLGGTCQP